MFVKYSSSFLPIIPVITQPIPRVILNMFVTVVESKSLSLFFEFYLKQTCSCRITKGVYGCSRKLLLTGTFFWETTTAQFSPRTPTEVKPPWLIALNAYSGIVEKKMVSFRSLEDGT